MREWIGALALCKMQMKAAFIPHVKKRGFKMIASYNSYNLASGAFFF